MCGRLVYVGDGGTAVKTKDGAWRHSSCHETPSKKIATPRHGNNFSPQTELCTLHDSYWGHGNNFSPQTRRLGGLCGLGGLGFVIVDPSLDTSSDSDNDSLNSAPFLWASNDKPAAEGAANVESTMSNLFMFKF